MNIDEEHEEIFPLWEKEEILKDNEIFRGKHKNPRRRKEVIQHKGVEVLRLQKKLEIDIFHPAILDNNRETLTRIQRRFMFVLMGLFILGGVIFESWNVISLWSIIFVCAYMIYKLPQNKHYEIELNDDKLVIKEYFFGLKKRETEVAVNKVRQYFIKKKKKIRSFDDKVLFSYSLAVVLRNNNRKVEIISGLDKNASLYIEQQIEDFLDIKDKKVSGDIVTPDED